MPARMSFRRKLEQKEYEKWIRLWGYRLALGFDCGGFVHTTEGCYSWKFWEKGDGRNEKNWKRTGQANEMTAKIICTEQRQVKEVGLCVWSRRRRQKSGAERQHSPHIRGSDKDLGRRV